MSSQKYNKLAGKHVIVIGGTSGIGYGVAEAAIASSAGTVTITSSSASKVEAAASALRALASPNQQVQGFVTDLTSPAADALLDDVFKQATASHPVDHVVFTAADHLTLMTLDDFTPEKITAATRMRLIAPLMVAKVAAKYLPKTRFSSLTITSGAASHKATPGWAIAAYFSAGLQGLPRQLAVEMAPVRVNAVAPGYVDTGLWDGMSSEAKATFVEQVEKTLPTGKFAQVEDVVEAYLWVMKDANVTGTVAETNSGAFVV